MLSPYPHPAAIDGKIRSSTLPWGASGTDQRETTIVGTPAVIKERDNPMTPSPVILPFPVLQALSTTNSRFKGKFRISAAVSNPLSPSEGVRAIAPGTPVPKSSSNPWVAKWRMRPLPSRDKRLFRPLLSYQGLGIQEFPDRDRFRFRSR